MSGGEKAIIYASKANISLGSAIFGAGPDVVIGAQAFHKVLMRRS